MKNPLKKSYFISVYANPRRGYIVTMTHVDIVSVWLWQTAEDAMKNALAHKALKKLSDSHSVEVRAFNRVD